MMNLGPAEISKQVLEGIKKVAVIDDVFDLPDIEHLYSGELEDFFTALDASDTAQDELSKLDPDIMSSRSLENDKLQKLWEHIQQNQETELAKLCNSTLFVNILQDWNQVTSFCNYLEKELNLSLITLGTPVNLDEHLKESVELIFIDYYLGPDIHPVQTLGSENETRIPAQERSIAFVKSIKADQSTNTKPFVVLMSSRPITPIVAQQFREETGWIHGMFYFIHKNEFNQKQQLSLLLGALAKSLPTGYTIQRFVDTLDVSLNSVTEQFIKDIRTLSVSDYTYIQKLSLLTDGHPLGDYMLWLYGSYLNYLLFENEPAVSQQRLELNGLSFKDIPTVQVAPSLQLVKIYKSALFDDHVNEVNTHPLAIGNLSTTPIGVEAEKPTDQPDLHLGDLFINESSNNVLMIINPECDLAFSPGEKRTIPSDRSIILIQGELQHLKAPVENTEQLRTELFEYKNNEYRIIWKIKQVVSYPFNEVAGSLRKTGYARIARLRQPYALEIQNAFASNLTRVGMPVPPPAYQPIDVSIVAKGENGDHKLVATFSSDSAYLAKMKDGERCILTLGFVMEIMKYAISLVTKLGEDLDALDTNQQGYQTRRDRLVRRRDDIHKATESSVDWLQLLTPFELKDDGEKIFDNLSIKISRGKSIEGKYNHQQAILISIVDVLTEAVNQTGKENG